MEYEGLQLTVFADVYEPAEDSFLLARCGQKLQGSILEIGCGSGIVSLINARANPENRITGVDISPRAVECAERNARRNGMTNARFFQSDLFSALPASEKFDAILFNPPYLPTAPEEKVADPLNAAFDGGLNGRAVVDRFLETAPERLWTGGRLMIVQSSLNNRQQTEKKLRNRRMTVVVQAEEAFFFERIYVLEATKKL